jgi:hypothetical protein
LLANSLNAAFRIAFFLSLSKLKNFENIPSTPII